MDGLRDGQTLVSLSDAVSVPIHHPCYNTMNQDDELSESPLTDYEDLPPTLVNEEG